MRSASPASFSHRRLLNGAVTFSSIIGTGTSIGGSFVGDGNILIQGTVQGDSDINGVVVILESGKWHGRLCADVVVVAGYVEGDIEAREKLEILRGGHIKGNLDCKVIAMETGAIHEGEIRMQQKGRLTEFTEKRRDPLLHSVLTPG